MRSPTVVGVLCAERLMLDLRSHLAIERPDVLVLSAREDLFGATIDVGAEPFGLLSLVLIG